jgi:predicted metal-dependent HD superfamily phosphohydrolase
MHDVVWSPDATEAEAASAAWARERLASRGVNAALLDRMTELILATRHRASPPTSRDEALVRDLDLLVFAAPPEIFDRCTELIRREYGHLPTTPRGQAVHGSSGPSGTTGYHPSPWRGWRRRPG